MTDTLKTLIVEDNQRLRTALEAGLSESGEISIIGACDNGEEAFALCLDEQPDVILMDVQLLGDMNGIEAAVEIRREFPRMPVVFYSIQDDDAYYRDFRRSGILSHYAYVRT
jgi:DNA-binding NarL/FixJ family response regulator